MRIKKILTLVLIAFQITSVAFGATYESQCAGTSMLVKADDSVESECPNYKIYYQLNGKTKKILYQACTDHMYVACIEGFDHKQYLLLEETCGGSVCSDFGEYRIIDPSSKKILLDKESYTVADEIGVKKDDLNSKTNEMQKRFNHEQKNIKAAKKILGYTPPLLPLINKFCCGK